MHKPFQKYGQYSYFKKLTLENVRCFGKKQQIFFSKSKGKKASNWIIIIGENGTGKTTILRCLTTLLAFQEQGKSWKRYFDYNYFYRSREFKPRIKFEFENYIKDKTTPITWEVDLNFVDGEVLPDDSFDRLKIETLNIFAYGASRTISDTAISKEQDFPAISLYEEKANLINAEEWLIQADYLSYKDEQQQNVIKNVKKLLLRLLKDEVCDLQITTHKGRPSALFKTGYGWVDLHNLSLGHKTLIAWLVDFARGMFTKFPDSDDPFKEPAILMVDEIDLHVHPRFQRDLIQFLTKTFPKTQFIVTAHSPLIVQATPDATIILLKREDDHIKVENNPEIIKNWRIDQLLTSDLFGLEGTRTPEIEAKIKRRRELLVLDELSEKQKKELEKLDKELETLPSTESAEALKAIEIIKRAAKGL